MSRQYSQSAIIYNADQQLETLYKEKEKFEIRSVFLSFFIAKWKLMGSFLVVYMCVYPCLYPWQLNSMFHVNQNKPLAALPHEHCTELLLKGSSCSNLCARSFLPHCYVSLTFKKEAILSLPTFGVLTRQILCWHIICKSNEINLFLICFSPITIHN